MSIFKQDNSKDDEARNRSYVYQLKEIENLGSKMGVVAMTIKDVLQGLVDDGLVDTDKIGSGNFYWRLASKAGQKQRQMSQSIQNDLERSVGMMSREKERRRDLKADRIESIDRSEKLERLGALKEQEA